MTVRRCSGSSPRASLIRCRCEESTLQLDYGIDQTSCDSLDAGAYWSCLGQAPLEVDPVAYRMVGEPGSARYGRSSTTSPTTGSISFRQLFPAPCAQAIASATQSIGSWFG